MTVHWVPKRSSKPIAGSAGVAAGGGGGGEGGTDAAAAGSGVGTGSAGIAAGARRADSGAGGGVTAAAGRGRWRLRRRGGGNRPTLLKVGETLFEGTYAITCTDRDHQTCDCDDGERQHQKYCQSNFHNGIPSRLMWADASRLRVRAKVGCGGLWNGSKGLDVFFLMWGERHEARTGRRCRHSRIPCALGNRINSATMAFSESKCGYRKSPHNELNRTTPGTNLLPSINHAQMSRRWYTTSVQRRQCGLGMGGN